MVERMNDLLVVVGSLSSVLCVGLLFVCSERAGSSKRVICCCVLCFCWGMRVPGAAVLVMWIDTCILDTKAQEKPNI